MKRFSLAVAVAFCSLVAATVVGQARRRSVAPAVPERIAFGEPLRGLTVSQTDRFYAGRRELDAQKSVQDGLGPVFNGVTCAECHDVPVMGGGSNRTVTRIGTVTDGSYDDLTGFGGSLLQNRGINPQLGSTHPFRGEVPPPAATIVARRRATPLFGLGLVEATPDATFIALAAQEAARGDGTAGRVNLVDNPAAGTKTVGKYGWKAQVPTLFRFSGDALLNELGITNPGFPNENCPSGDCGELQFNPRPGLNDSGQLVQALADYMTMLGPPPRDTITPAVTAGEAVFNRIGCNSCHVTSLQTGASADAAYDRVTYQPFSDFLLHDMGPLGDGIVQEGAGPRDIRTAPLWGLRVVTRFLHDGRAQTLDGAVTAHDGQGRAARDRFNALNAADRANLLAFLRSL